MESKNTGRRGVNFIDIIILLLIVGVVAAAVMLFSKQDSGPAASGVNLTYQMELTNIVEELANCAQVGDTVTESKTKSVLGTIVDVKVEPMVDNTFDSLTGTMRQVTYPGRYRITLTCETPAKRVGEKLVISDFTIGVGAAIDFKSKNFAGEAFCTALSIQDPASKEAA